MATSTTFPTSEDRPIEDVTGAALSSSGAPQPQDVRRLAERVAGGAHALADRTTEKLAPVAEKLRAGAGQASEALQARSAQLGEWQERLASDTRASVRDHPLAWVAGAFVAGMVIARLARD